MDQVYMAALQVMRQRRLADVGVPHAGAEAVLRRHLLPARTSLRSCSARAPMNGASAERHALMERIAGELALNIGESGARPEARQPLSGGSR